MANINAAVPTGLVTTWIDQQMPQRHAVFRAHDVSTQRARAPNISEKGVSDITNDFCNIIQQYGKSLSSHTSAGINIRGAHSWDEVVRAAQDAEAAYLADARKGIKGQVRGYLRRFGDYSATMTPWVGLLPSDQYFSVLCGSLKLVLGIAARRSERRIMIFETFETLPIVIEKVQRSHVLYPSSFELREKALAVYFDILTMTEAMIATLMEKKFLDRIKDGLRGPLADTNVDEKRKRFQMSMTALEDQAEYLHRASSATANASIATMAPSVQNIEHVVTSLDGRVRVWDDSARNISTGIEGLRNSQDQTTQRLQREIEMQRHAIELQSQVQSQAFDNLSSILHDVIRNAEWNGAQKQIAHEKSMNLRNLQVQLESHLSHSQTVSNQDLDVMTRSAQSCDARSQGAMHWVLQSPRFKFWLQSQLPDILAVNGNLEDGTARYSSTTLLCGMLIRSLREQEVTHVLHFFCGAHNSRHDSSAGPRGLIHSLIAQLLSIQQFDVGFLRFGQWEEGVRANNVGTYCRLFSRLVEQLPNSVVFCIIDGISLFEREGWVEDLQLILQTLLNTAADEQLNTRIKLLTTSTSRSRCLDHMLSESNKLRVPTNVGDRQLLSSRTAHNELKNGRRSPMYGSVPPTSSYEDAYETGFE